MKSTISLLQSNELLIEDAEAELANLETLPYYQKFSAYEEKERDKNKRLSRIRNYKLQRLAILEKLEAQIIEEKKKLQSVTNAEAA